MQFKNSSQVDTIFFQLKEIKYVSTISNKLLPEENIFSSQPLGMYVQSS